MAPTHGYEEIEGRYKEYAYSPVSASSTSAVYHSTTLGTYPKENGAGTSNCRINVNNSVQKKRRVAEMAEKGSTLPQYIAAATANLCVVGTGAMLGWTSPIGTSLMSNGTDSGSPLSGPITVDENSWIGSLVAIGAMLGSFIAGDLAERFGRKITLLSSVVPFMIGWALIATAGHVEQLYAARFVLGIALAFTFTAVPMYCGEIAETSVRGALGSFLQLFISFGLLYSYSIGPYVSYTIFWILCAAVPIVFVVCFIFMPESPYYLMKVGKRDAAISALAKLRSKSTAGVEKEADEMEAAIQEAFKEEAKLSDLFTVKANFKALIFTCLMASFQQLSGINVVLFYMGTIFESAKSSLPSAVSTIIVGAVQLAASGVTPIVVDRLGRKMLLIFSGVGEIVSLTALGIYFYLQKYDAASVESISFLPVVSLIIFIATYCVGWGPLPWTVMGEMFSSTVKSKASGITVCVCWFLAFIMTKFASTLQNAFGAYTLYWLCAVFCLISVLFTIFILPETKGKSLQEIQDELNGFSSEVPEFNGSGSKK
ncbi:facilitated trehalose transporter Tret1-2 homolog [Ceratina calcarata]|uniref:Facilitated trehalose transporter Tret1-2 homolog n=1 Tax=Ceratina calcarata TaxID=156304 RepID=A0AAJ7IT23_9HYME|nr:facilitated trehalose transporter Tret1-2 homolog [Ceratina calcarata]